MQGQPLAAVVGKLPAGCISLSHCKGEEGSLQWAMWYPAITP